MGDMMDLSSKEYYLHKTEIIRTKGIAMTDLMEHYSGWAESYDQGAVNSEIYNPPRYGGETLSELLGNRKDALILDAAAGTGLCGLQLHNKGFTHLDALDANAAMLKEAKKKNIYNRLICDFMGPNKLDIPDNTYDAIVTVGSFTEGHVNQDCFPEMIRIMKPGGVFVLVMREENLVICDIYRDKLEPDMQALEDAGLWRKIKRDVVPNYYSNYNGVSFVFEKL